jgi:muconolactone delta-isomerase
MSLTLVAPNIEGRKEEEKMKFLITSTPKDTWSTLPPAISRQLLEANIAFINQQKQAGKLLEIYSAPDGCTIAICEHPSAEDLTQTLAGVPGGGLLNFEVHPLADYVQTMKAYIEAAKAAEQLFPAAPR